MFTRTSFIDGIRVGIGPAAATFAVGMAFGSGAAAAGWGSVQSLLFSMLAFSGSAQFTLLTTFSAGGAVAAVTAAVLINARYLVMGIALNDSLQGSRLWRAVQAQTLIDASFALAHRGSGQFDIARLAGTTLPSWLAWVAGTAAGLLARPDPSTLHALAADVVFPAFFLILVIDEVRSNRRAAAGATCGVAIAGLLVFWVQPGYALVAATGGALIGLLPLKGGPTARRRGEEDRR
ncbi:branched-chain amino acid permease [Knoellia sinensis KCTC 19936]|uniref:Branched-chain amino acid permease n=1 Tax=Knoellia sinensis KCTC 19936 TaxID=1385520 RepID=A0A0A0J862_9MICO|nr:AzlC family ABC transporter permease [Knoellia sinensis]KGN32939.1 branched-chain amino acid permease [Knoellia sinensis KCTC 19936]